MSECIVRGDLANVRIGRHCILSKKSVIRPPFKKFSKGYVHFFHHLKLLISTELVGWLVGCLIDSLLQNTKHVHAIIYLTLEVHFSPFTLVIMFSSKKIQLSMLHRLGLMFILGRIVLL